jgi:O-antigen/teichoic acid export membrane protein
MIRAWGVAGYGEWIALTSLAAILSYSDFGLVTPSVNEIVMAVGAGDIQRARSHLRRSISAVFLMVTPAVLATAFGLAMIDYRARLHFEFIDNASCTIVIVASAWNILSRTMRGLFVATLYANGDYGVAYTCTGVVRALELGVVAGIVYSLSAPPAIVAAVSAAFASVDLVAIGAFSLRRVAWASLLPEPLTASWLRRLGRPALGFALSNTTTQLVMVMGPRIALGVLSGGAAVALYALYATMMRLVDQCVLIFLQPLEIEMAHSAGRGDRTKVAQLVAIGAHASWAVFATIVGGLAIIGPYLFPIWTHGQIAFDYGIFAFGGLMFGCNQLGRVCAQTLIATNRMYGPSARMMAWSLIAIAVGSGLTVRFGVRGMFCGGIIGELGLSLIATVAVARWLGLPIARLLFDIGWSRDAARLLLSWARQRAPKVLAQDRDA